MQEAHLSTGLIIQYIIVGIILLSVVIWIIWKWTTKRPGNSGACCGCSLQQTCGKKAIKNKVSSCDTMNEK